MKRTIIVLVFLLVVTLTGCTKETYDIEFIVEGKPYQTVEITEKELLTEPVEPTIDGYEFIGWYTDASFAEEYDFSDVIIRNLTLYAKFEIKLYQLNVLGVGINLSVGVPYNASVDLVIQEELPEIEGYGLYQDDFHTMMFSGHTMPASDLTVYIHEEPLIAQTDDFVISSQDFYEHALLTDGATIALSFIDEYLLDDYKDDITQTQLDNKILEWTFGTSDEEELQKMMINQEQYNQQIDSFNRVAGLSGYNAELDLLENQNDPSSMFAYLWVSIAKDMYTEEYYGTEYNPDLSTQVQNAMNDLYETSNITIHNRLINLQFHVQGHEFTYQEQSGLIANINGFVITASDFYLMCSRKLPVQGQQMS